jgi:multimeric flavodoxin WrbA
MQVLGISGSMRPEGNTSRLIKIILEECGKGGIETEFISLADKDIKPCRGCESCKIEKACVHMDDDWSTIIERVLACEVLVLGGPTYYYDINGHLKNFIDRTYSLYHDRRLSGRIAVGVTCNADKGGNRALQTLEGFFSSHEFSYFGGVSGKGYLSGEVLQDAHAVKRAREIGQKIVKFLRPSD